MRRMQSVARKAGVVLSALALAGMALSPSLALAETAQDAPGTPTEKVETVNVTTAADGSVTGVEVETTLKNGDGASRLADLSDLTDIEASDDVGFSRSGSDLVWDAKGDSVTYTGKSDAALPVAITVTYTIDGAQVSAADIAGKSGRVTIRYEYENLSAHVAQVNGAETEMATPFTCVTAIMLDGETFKNVAVTNAKVIEDGSDVIVTGYAMPGLKESLGSLAEDADIPDYFEVSADVEEFELKSTMTIVTAGLMSDFATDDLGFDDLSESSSELSSAMSKLAEGSDALTEGMSELAEGASQLDAGAAQLAEGSQGLVSGLYLLAYGEDGKGGLAAAAGSSAELATGASKAAEAAGALADSEQGVPAAADALGQAAAAAPSAEAIAALKADSAYNSLNDESKKTIEALVAQSQTVGALAPALAQQAEGVKALAQEMPAIAQGAAALSAGLSGASTAAAQLYAGAGGIAAGASQLSDGTSQLSSGMSSAADGSKALSDGLAAFRDEGIGAIVDMVDNDLGGLRDRIDALSEASRAYDNFGGKTDGTSGSVKFIYETEAITAE